MAEPWESECCFCGADMPLWPGSKVGRGNNPEPLETWPRRCCDECNITLVIPARLGRLND